MRYVIWFAMALALLASPLRVMAQTAQVPGSDGRPHLAFLLIPKHLQERLPQHHALSEPESKFSLEYQEQKSPAVQEMELRVKRARIGLGVSGIAYLAGASMGVAALYGFLSVCFISDPLESCHGPSWVAPVGWTGTALLVGGLAGMIASGVLLRRRKRDRDSVRQGHFGTPRRVQWDLARSRVVF